ncbi:MAG: peptidase [Desulfuromonadales bacterium]|nr:peptidase [Desulfuromonadales bacterium]
MLDTAFRSLFETNMGIKPGETVLVFSDRIRQDEAPSEADRDRRLRLNETARQTAGFASSSYGSGQFVDFPATGASGVEPPQMLWEATFGRNIMSGLQKNGILDDLFDKCVTPEQLIKAREIVAAHAADVPRVIIAMSNNSSSHTNYRKLACAAGARFASLPHFDPDMFGTSMNVDWTALADRTARLVAAVNRAEWVNVECPNGTAMHICKQGRDAGGDDGLLTQPGSFGNLPAGEAYFAPLEGESHGIMVIEWGATRKLDSPLTLTIADGRVLRIDGDDPLRAILEARFAGNEACRNLAELGIGTNDKASRPDNVLEAEKIMGTIHMALGDNTGFGGVVAAPFHEDYVFYQPTVTLVLADGTEEIILDAGKLQV